MTAVRMQFLLMAVIILIGIWLSGFDQVQWFLYIPLVMLVFAGVTGICPGMMIWEKLGFK